MKAFWFAWGIVIGLLVGGMVQYKYSYVTDQRPGTVQLTEQIVLTIPRNEKEAEKQLLYMAASKAMLEEIHRQKVLRRQ